MPHTDHPLTWRWWLLAGLLLYLTVNALVWLIERASVPGVWWR